jgi:single-strand DNA-binding protein
VARSLNKVTLIGNAGSDPEIRSTTSGSRVAQFNLATSRRWTSQSGEQQEKTEWHRIVAWERKNAGGGDPFNVIERFVKKGEKLYVEGEIQYRSYEDKDGVTKYITEIIPRDLILLGSGGGGSGESHSSGGGARQQPNRERAAAGKQSRGDYDDFQAPPLEDDDDLPF